MKSWLLAFALVVVPCSTALANDWADDLETFVDDKVPQITRDYADAALRKMWVDAYTAPLADISSLQLEIAQRLPDQALPAFGADNAAADTIAVARVLDVNIAQVRFDRARLDALDKQLATLREACEKPEIYSSETLRQLGALALGNVMLPDGPKYGIIWLGDPYFISTIVSLVVDLVLWSQDKDMRERAHAALDRLPAQVAAPAWVAIRSKATCQEVRRTRLTALDHYARAVAGYKMLLANQESAYLAAQAKLDTILLSRRYDSIRKAQGVDTAELDKAQRSWSSGLLVDLELALNEVRTLGKAAANGGGCRKGVARVEAYEDAVLELKAQLGRIAEERHPRVVSDRFATVGKGLEKRIADLPVLYARAKTAPCE